MSGFGNDNNNENQDFGALNMGPDSMFSAIPGSKNPQTPNIPNIQNQGLSSGQPQVPPTPQTQGMPQQPQAPQQQRVPNMPQAPQAKAQTSQSKASSIPPMPPKAEPKEEFDDEVITVKPIRFASFENEVSAVGTPRKNLDIMQDVKAKITVELGRCKMKVKKVLDIQKGSIIEINKVAGEQVELFVCGKLVAHGEVIVIEDKFGLRITSIIEDKSL